MASSWNPFPKPQRRPSLVRTASGGRALPYHAHHSTTATTGVPTSMSGMGMGSMPLSSPSLTIRTSSSGSSSNGSGHTNVGAIPINVNAPRPSLTTTAAHASLSAPTPTSVPSSRGQMYSVVRLTNVRIVRNGRLEHDDLWMNNGKVDPILCQSLM
jgi:hypothetical protein